MPALRILIIDDDEDDFFLTSHFLKQISDFDIVCDWCNSAEKALDLLRLNSYDIYFVDYLLGTKTGLDLIREALQLGASKPIVFLSGMGSVDTEKSAIALGAYDYLKKDELSGEKLERCIRYSLERYKSFKAIQDSEKKYRLIFENAFSFVFICDTNFVIGETNKGSEFILGFNSNELKGKSLRDLLPESETNLFSVLSKQKTIANYNLGFLTKQNELRRGTLSMSCFSSTELAPFWLGVLHDDTWRVQAEASKLQIEKLNATQRLIRTLAHEIRNPLTNMSLAANSLQDFEMSSTQLEYLDILQRSGIRINSILNELLHSSKDIDLVKKDVDLRDVLQLALKNNQDRIALKRIGVTLTLPNTQSIVHIDAERFSIALSNLIINAIEALPERNGRLTIELQQTETNFSIVVSDNGVGIDETQLSSLFEPYYTTKRSGMGLGLISTLNILKAHKAQINVQSEPGQGTKFTIVLPI